MNLQEKRKNCVDRINELTSEIKSMEGKNFLAEQFPDESLKYAKQDLIEIDKQIENKNEEFINLINSGNLKDIKDCYLKQIESIKFKPLREKYNFIFLVLNTSCNSDVLEFFINEYKSKLSNKINYDLIGLVIKFSKNVNHYESLYTVTNAITRKEIDSVFYPAIFECIKSNNTKGFDLLKFLASAKVTFYSNNKIKEFKKYMNIIDGYRDNNRDDIKVYIKLDEIDTIIDSESDFECV